MVSRIAKTRRQGKSHREDAPRGTARREDPGTKRELFVEGGGERNPSLASECRRAFSKLFEAAGIRQRPRVIACGSRNEAYKQFRLTVGSAGTVAWLLVDAEEPVRDGSTFDPWAHVASRKDNPLERPDGATNAQLHLMTVTMETWLLADHAALKKVLGSKLDTSHLPPEGAALERLNKQDMDVALHKATKSTPSGGYAKGQHSFKGLAAVSPAQLKALPWADRFLRALADE